MRDTRFLAVVVIVVLLLIFNQAGLAILVAILAGGIIFSRKLDQHDGDYPPPDSGLPHRKGKYITIKAPKKTPPPN